MICIHQEKECRRVRRWRSRTSCLKGAKIATASGVERDNVCNEGGTMLSAGRDNVGPEERDGVLGRERDNVGWKTRMRSSAGMRQRLRRRASDFPGSKADADGRRDPAMCRLHARSRQRVMSRGWMFRLFDGEQDRLELEAGGGGVDRPAGLPAARGRRARAPEHVMIRPVGSLTRRTRSRGQRPAAAGWARRVRACRPRKRHRPSRARERRPSPVAARGAPAAPRLPWRHPRSPTRSACTSPSSETE